MQFDLFAKFFITKQGFFSSKICIRIM